MRRARALRWPIICLRIYIGSIETFGDLEKWFGGQKSSKRMSVGLCSPMCLAAFQGFVRNGQHDIFRNLGKPYHLMSAPRWGEMWNIESCYIFERTRKALRLPMYHVGMWSPLTIEETYKL